MLEYCKAILQKVSFDEKLFEKELRKSIHYLKLKDENVEEFLEWCRNTFGDKYNVSI